MIKFTTKKPFFIRWYMDLLGYDGLATTWNTVYLRDESMFSDKKLIAHEEKHIEQMERDGKFWYLIKYHYYWIKYGYKNNPYEIEARNAHVD